MFSKSHNIYKDWPRLGQACGDKIPVYVILLALWERSLKKTWSGESFFLVNSRRMRNASPGGTAEASQTTFAISSGKTFPAGSRKLEGTDFLFSDLGLAKPWLIQGPELKIFFSSPRRGKNSSRVQPHPAALKSAKGGQKNKKIAEGSRLRETAIFLSEAVFFRTTAFSAATGALAA